MSTNQTKAQRLADLIGYCVPRDSASGEAAALLRRQEELLRQALAAMEESHDQSLDGMHFRCRQTLLEQIKAIRNHLEAK